MASDLDLTTEAVPEQAHGHEDGPPTLVGWIPRVTVLLVIAYLVIIEVTRHGETITGVAVDAAVYVVVGLSLNILIGYTGQLSLGHQGFVGIGAFGAAYASTVKGVPFAVAMVIAMVVGGLFALFLGVIALRITGLYLALITLVFGRTLEESLFQVGWLTQGGAGQPADRPEMFLPMNRYYWLCLAIVAGVLYVDWRLTHTKSGRALFALRENERAAAAFGINVTAFKLLGFVLSGAFAGLAGAMFAYRSGVANGSDFDFFLALTFVLMVVVGGLNSRVGVVIGSAFFASLPFLLTREAPDRFLHSVFGENAQFAPNLIGAVLLLTTLIFNPGGIAQQNRPLTRWLAGHRFTFHSDEETSSGAVEGSNVRA